MIRPVRAEDARRLFPLVFVLAVGLAVWPLCRPGYLPIEDLPQHLAAIRVLHSFYDPSFGFSRYFERDLLHTQYLAYYVLADLLSYVLPLELANRVLVVASVAAIPLAALYLMRALGRPQWLALFALPLTWNAHLILGFINFLMAIALALLGLGLAAKHARAPGPRSGAALALVALACFLAHVVPFALFALGSLLLFAGRHPRQLFARAWPLLPSGVAGLVWLVASPAGRATANAVHGAWGAKQAVYEPAALALRDLPNWLIDTLRGDEDRQVLYALWALCAVTIVIGLAAWGVRRRRHRAPSVASDRLWLRLLPLPPIALSLYFLTPSSYDWIWPIAQRFPLLAGLLLIPVLPSPPPAAGAALAVALVTLTGYQAQLVGRAFAQFDAQEVGDFEQALAAIPARSRVMGLIWARGSRYVKFSPFIHFVAYYQARKGGAVMFTFADFPQSPFRFREGDRPPRVPPRWEWLPARVQPSDLRWYQYVLVRAGPSPCVRAPGACRLSYRGRLWSVWRTLR